MTMSIILSANCLSQSIITLIHPSTKSVVFASIRQYFQKVPKYSNNDKKKSNEHDAKMIALKELESLRKRYEFIESLTPEQLDTFNDYLSKPENESHYIVPGKKKTNVPFLKKKSVVFLKEESRWFFSTAKKALVIGLITWLVITFANFSLRYITQKNINLVIEYEDNLKVYRKNAEDNPATHLPYVAATLNDLAILHSDMKEFSKALEKYEEALKIYQKLAEDRPTTYLPDVAMLLNSLSLFYLKAVPAKEKSIEYAKECVELAIHFQHIPRVQEYAKTAIQILHANEVDVEEFLESVRKSSSKQTDTIKPQGEKQ